MGEMSAFWSIRTQTAGENMHFSDVLEWLWVQREKIRFLYPGIFYFVGHFKEKEPVEAHNICRYYKYLT